MMKELVFSMVFNKIPDIRAFCVEVPKKWNELGLPHLEIEDWNEIVHFDDDEPGFHYKIKNKGLVFNWEFSFWLKHPEWVGYERNTISLRCKGRRVFEEFFVQLPKFVNAIIAFEKYNLVYAFVEFSDVLNSPSYKDFRYDVASIKWITFLKNIMWNKQIENVLESGLELIHEDSCGRILQTKTVPEHLEDHLSNIVRLNKKCIAGEKLFYLDKIF